MIRETDDQRRKRFGGALRTLRRYYGFSVGDVARATEGLKYLNMGKVRKMTRSQKNYRDYLDADIDCTFSEWMGWS